MLRRLVVLILATLPVAMAQNTRVVEEIAAKVNGDIITRGELEQIRKESEQRHRAEGLTGAKLAEAVQADSARALSDQIDLLLLVQKGKDLGISVDGDVTRELADMQVASKISDPDKFHDAIRQQYGMSFEEFRDKMRRQYLAQRVIGQEVGYRIQIPDAEMRKFYDEHKSEYVRKEQVFLSQILISTEGKTPEQVAVAEQKAKDLTARAKKGEKFSDLVRDNSDDPETVRTGGALPPYQRGMMEKSWDDQVFAAKKGDIVGPLKGPLGFVILRVDDRYEAGQASFEEVRNDIQDRMARPRMEPKIRQYLTTLRQEAYLEIKEGYTDAGQAPGKDTRWHDVAQLKPQTITKEEVAARTKQHKRFMNLVPIPGTEKPIVGTAPVAPAAKPATTTGAAGGAPAPESNPAPVKQ
ncbi:MAG TPA: peptidylprolyl isomerase [Bryobacteraceae bacterium]|nr:peptidylprolyl isomerase [Bryobacteraceae bacterium]